jgi:hypothetical protein
MKDSKKWKRILQNCMESMETQLNEQINKMEVWLIQELKTS